MADICVWFVFVLSFATGSQTVEKVKELYCRDPDTGNLHQVNTTWQAKSFCGNYSCRIKKRNSTEMDHTKLQNINFKDIHTNFDNEPQKVFVKHLELPKMKNNKQVNTVTDISPKKPDKNTTAEKSLNKNETLNDMSMSPSNSLPTIATAADNKTMLNFLKPNNNYKFQKDDEESEDRFLSESEIKEISEILQTVKKADLEAIIDIYNLAQEIYKEIDSIGTTTDTMFKQTSSPLNNFPFTINEEQKNNDQTPYWYKPITHRGRDTKLTTPTIVETSYNPSTFNYDILAKNTYKKLPYYYPISDFQRLSSYIKPTDATKKSERKYKPCDKTLQNVIDSLQLERPRPLPVLLPYPYSHIHHYKTSSYPAEVPYNSYPWEKPGIYNKNKHSLQLNPNLYTEIPSTARLSKYYEEKDVKYRDVMPAGQSSVIENKNLADWQTEPLTVQILEEVKGNVMNKTKLLNLFPRKNIKLEKVGKVIKLDEHERQKRFITSSAEQVHVDEYETYLEKKTCESSTEIGFFRHGNQTAPYPHCCPQKIKTR